MILGVLYIYPRGNVPIIMFCLQHALSLSLSLSVASSLQRNNIKAERRVRSMGLCKVNISFDKECFSKTKVRSQNEEGKGSFMCEDLCFCWRATCVYICLLLHDSSETGMSTQMMVSSSLSRPVRTKLLYTNAK